jgi:hypothetical protein
VHDDPFHQHPEAAPAPTGLGVLQEIPTHSMRELARRLLVSGICYSRSNSVFSSYYLAHEKCVNSFHLA